MGTFNPAALPKKKTYWTLVGFISGAVNVK